MFVLTLRPYLGILKYFNHASQLAMEGMFTSSPAKIWRKGNIADEASGEALCGNFRFSLEFSFLSACMHGRSHIYRGFSLP